MSLHKRYEVLDVLRIICAMAIFLFHSNMYLGEGREEIFLTGFISQCATLMGLFFLLSGFGMYYNYNNVNWLEKKNIVLFYCKRLIAIYPSYLFVHLIYIVFYNNYSLIKNILLIPIELLGLQSYFTSLTFQGLTYISHNSGTWFISSLFVCYFVFPLIEILVSMMNKKQLWVVIFLIYIVLAICPIAEFYFETYPLYRNPLFRVMEFAFGVMLAKWVIESENKERSVLLKIFCETVVYILFVSWLSEKPLFLDSYMRYNFVSIPFFGFVVYLFCKCENKYMLLLAKHNVTKYFASLTYGFYLGQLFCFKFTKMMLVKIECDDIGYFIKALIALAICFGVANILYFGVEKPSRKFLMNKLLRGEWHFLG